MMLILAVTLLLFYALLAMILYNRNISILESEVKQEAHYIQAAVNITGAEYLEQMGDADRNTRITWIGKDGEVFYDSEEDNESLENHSGRKEVREALANGEGEEVRMSDTLGEELYYYAVLLDDGSVLRVARSMDGLIRIAVGVFPVMAVLAVLMMLLALALATWQTKRLIKPINELNLEHPLDNDIYPELTPLLQAMDRQNKEKEAVSNMRKEFSANVSHELKTPLTSISGYAEIMKNGMVRPADIPVFSERIYKEARRLIHLVEDIIKLSKLDEESVELEKEDVNLYELTREVVSRLSPQNRYTYSRMEVTGEPVMYKGIRQILDEMVYNICENAVKYNNDNGRVSVWGGGYAGWCEDQCVRYRDRNSERASGTDFRTVLPGGQESLERARRNRSGLSIVKHGAILHGAKVTVESESGKGTRMEIHFPKEQQAETGGSTDGRS